MTKLISNQLANLGIQPLDPLYFQLSVPELVEHAIRNQEASLSDSGALCFQTGQFTGRCPESRFLVHDELTAQTVNWGKVNKPITGQLFELLLHRVSLYLSDIPLYIRTVQACNHPKFAQEILTVTEGPCQDIFVHNMFINTDVQEQKHIDWTVLVASKMEVSDYADLGLPTAHCVLLDLSKQLVLIIGTAYTGEIKKSIFSALNYYLPLKHKVLTMHCAANVGKEKDTALFFGLSGTGKTTLSSDEGRYLIGDDEHGWSEEEVFNFEGGCYAKTIGLSAQQEPQIYNAIKFGSLVENVLFKPGTREVDFDNANITENMRASYPIDHLTNINPKGQDAEPKHIFYLSADAFGILPAISKLNAEQAMYYFLNGYTAKVAGTELGVKTPTATFSACFGAAFLPLHPMHYAQMLKEKLEANPNIQVWLVNTGWVAGPYGVGRRISLTYTRQLIRSAMNSHLGDAGFEEHPIFGLNIPKECPGIPSRLLNPKKMWDNEEAYDELALKLKSMFDSNYKQFVAAETLVK
ncbi:phosphoenolpyruvate carboxykinase (ATP) [Sphingobacterium sp. HJSM2_6]|uniref:phosphoenolpyruvate carboxykinase (ATP) n=1 Tax=Sphingobacterium sp. HJSM2_6 TaxID=3366264 RepID=UPI003BD56508